MANEYIEIDLGYSPIPVSGMRKLDEVTIKNEGHVWRIHKTDLDHKPSNPHAINLETGLKLDLSNGDLYFQTQWRNKIPKKHLLDIRQKAEEKGGFCRL